MIEKPKQGERITAEWGSAITDAANRSSIAPSGALVMDGRTSRTFAIPNIRDAGMWTPVAAETVRKFTIIGLTDFYGCYCNQLRVEAFSSGEKIYVETAEKRIVFFPGLPAFFDGVLATELLKRLADISRVKIQDATYKYCFAAEYDREHRHFHHWARGSGRAGMFLTGVSIPARNTGTGVFGSGAISPYKNDGGGSWSANVELGAYVGYNSTRAAVDAGKIVQAKLIDFDWLIDVDDCDP